MSSMFFQMEFATLYKNLKFNLKALLQNCLGSRYRKFALFLLPAARVVEEGFQSIG